VTGKIKSDGYGYGMTSPIPILDGAIPSLNVALIVAKAALKPTGDSQNAPPYLSERKQERWAPPSCNSYAVDALNPTVLGLQLVIKSKPYRYGDEVIRSPDRPTRSVRRMTP
jgi:hypothetical protein